MSTPTSSADRPYADDFQAAEQHMRIRKRQIAGGMLLTLVLATVLGMRSRPVPVETANVAATGAGETRPVSRPGIPGPAPGRAGSPPEAEPAPAKETAQAADKQQNPREQASPRTNEHRPAVTDIDTNMVNEELEDSYAVLPVPIPLPIPLPSLPGLPDFPDLPSLPSGLDNGNTSFIPVILPHSDPEHTEPAHPSEPDPPAASPLPKPHPAAINISPEGDYWVQLGAFNSHETGCIIWDDMMRVSPALFGGALKSVVPAPAANGQTLYRLRAGAFDTAENAEAFCTALKQTGRNCFTVRD